MWRSLLFWLSFFVLAVYILYLSRTVFLLLNKNEALLLQNDCDVSVKILPTAA